METQVEQCSTCVGMPGIVLTSSESRQGRQFRLHSGAIDLCSITQSNALDKPETFRNYEPQRLSPVGVNHLKSTDTMDQSLRSTLVVSDTLAAAVAGVAYISTFLGGTLERLSGLVFVLFALAFGNCALLVFFQPEESMMKIFDFCRSKPWPSWAKWTANLLMVAVIGHFVAFWFQCGWGVPQIKDGAYVIASRGHILKEITEFEYVRHRAAELRLICIFWIALFIPLTFEWLFPRKPSRVSK